ncbi:hypothetical protein MON38_17940 [Hymenobacter sp. DH14]|uniref:Uncharacterized protein n=1 Tax=Hymenobacter cyanobacteriorum TaxID=2926463 RepID=A0A9X2AJW7_9BACT|nr:hypothetical protein [Hymenobacter cyanobacteriorum]MCI1189309.1 hypothetical protein [Hymenobacter cyanobacteriorum]
MATDGVKIIDGDLAHDVYVTFMDLYDAGESIETVKTAIEQFQADNDDVDDEIFITAYALALWEVGQLDEEILSQVALAIKQNAFANYLTQSENAPNEGRKRQQVLNRFWDKISQPNIRPRKRKIHKAQTKFVFDEGDVLSFQMSDGTYRATILLLISQHRGRCSYQFAMPTYTAPSKATFEDVQNGEIMGRMIEPASRVGFNVVGMAHKTLLAIADRFERIGHLEITQAAKRCGAQSGAVDFESFASAFVDFNNIIGIKKTVKTHSKQVFPVRQLLQ